MSDRDEPGTQKAPPPKDAWSEAARRAVARHDATRTLFNRCYARFIEAICHLIMGVGNRVEVEGIETLEGARAEPRGLLTFSNHVSLFDDPWLTATFSSAEWTSLRWIAADALNFFGGPIRAFLGNAGKCVPVVRGAGLDQPGMDFLAERLRAGEWVHVFPEGGRTRDPEARLRRPLKGGLARLVRESRPLLLPFHHHGMQGVLPIGAWLPRVGNRVRVLFGEVHDSATGLADQGMDAITAWAEEVLLALEAENHPGA